MIPALIALVLLLDGCSDDDEGSGPVDEPMELPPQQDASEGETSADTVQRDSEDGFFDSLGPDDTEAPDAPSDVFLCVPQACASTLVVPMTPGSSKGLCVSFSSEDPASYGLDSYMPHRGLEIFDLDGDGKPEIYFKNQVTGDQLFRKVGSRFADVSDQWQIKSDGYTRDVVVSDIDGDGNRDVFTVGETQSLLMKNTGTFLLNLSAGTGIKEEGVFGTAAARVGSYVLLSTENGLRAYERQGGFDFDLMTQESGFTDYGNAASIVVADFNGDGMEDVYVANQTGSNRHFEGQADGTYLSIEDVSGTALEGSATDVEVVHLNGQQNPSLHVTNHGGPDQLYFNNQDGTFTERAAELGLQDAGPTMSTASAFLAGDQWPFFHLTRFGDTNLLMVPHHDDQGDFVDYRDRAGLFGMNVNGQSLDSAWIDVNDDGLLDLVTVAADGAVGVFVNKSSEVTLCR